jgi:glutaconate CoA-transferase subunit A
VVHAPFGAHPTYNSPDYGWDLQHLKEYSASASQEGGWERYFDQYLKCSEKAYQAKVAGAERIAALPFPVF